MKKGTTVTLIVIYSIIALALVSILVFLCIGRGIGRGNGFISRMGSGQMEIQKEKEYDVSGIENLNITFVSEKIKVYVSENDKLKIVQKASTTIDEDEKFIENKSGNSLDIKLQERFRFFNFMWFTEMEMEVYLPQSYINNLRISSVSGRIEVNTNINSKRLELANTSGKIECNLDITATESASITTVSGGIELLRKINTPDLKIASTSGKIELQQTETQDIDIHTVSGGIQIAALTGKGDIKSTSGSIRIDEFAIIGTTNLSTISGRAEVQLREDSSCNIYTKTISGKVVLPNDSNIVGKEPYNKLNIKTTSGRIEVRI